MISHPIFPSILAAAVSKFLHRILQLVGHQSLERYKFRRRGRKFLFAPGFRRLEKKNDDWPSYIFSFAAFTSKDMKKCFEELKKHQVRLLYEADKLQNSFDMCSSEEAGRKLQREEWLIARLKESDHQLSVPYRNRMETIHCHEVVRQLLVMFDSDNG
jgi:5-methylcytosine-specific restriction endonuclease McrBC GTP-binding regulatory subunit McrB